MISFTERARKGTCDVCGRETDIVVAASSCGPVSLGYCKNCLERGLEPYGFLVNYIAMAGDWPDDINETYQRIARKNLAFYGKSEGEFAADVKRARESFNDIYGG